MEYYESTANEPLEAVNKILRDLKYDDRSEIEFYIEGIGKKVNDDCHTDCVSPISFSVTLFEKPRVYCILAGTIINRGMNDYLKPVWDAGAELELVEF